MKFLFNRKCPHCGDQGISQILLFFLDVFGIYSFDHYPIRCSICSQRSSHPLWLKRLLFSFIFTSIPLGYIFALKYHSDSFFSGVFIIVAIACFVLSIFVPIKKLNSAPIGLANYVLKGLWLLEIVISLLSGFLALVNWITPNLFMWMLLLLAYTIWLSWDMFKQEIYSVFESRN